MKHVSFPPRRGALLPALLALTAAGCHDAAPPDEPAPASVAPAATLRRLTQEQYANTIHDLLGDDVLVAGGLEPDSPIADFLSVGAAQTGISSRGIEQYEHMAFDVAHQVLSVVARRARIVPCTPSAVSDAACAKTTLAALGRKLWRRPLTDEELTAHVTVATTAATTLGDFHAGLEYAVAALLQSPDFLYRVELGAPGAPSGAGSGAGHFTGWEMASRLSYFLWNGPPDDALLVAAESGALDGADGIAAQVERMMASPRARRGLRSFASEWLGLDALDDLVKDPMIFTQASSDLGPAAREQTLSDIERLAFDQGGDGGDFRDLFTSRTTSINRKLASVYGVRAPSQDGFGLVMLPEDQPRRGLLGQLSVLAAQAHPTTTSATLRGRFVQRSLLCREILPPPVNLNTAIPAPSPNAITMRQRLASHNADPFCAGCHERMDPIGLGLEQFDGLGALRTTEMGQPIDASGVLDGKPWKDAGELAQVIHDHAELGPCFARLMHRYAVGHLEAAGEEELVKWLGRRFERDNFRVRDLMVAIARSEAFRATAAPGSN